MIALVVLALSVGGETAGAQYARPFECNDCISAWFYFDHDETSGIEDWACADSTYDGHRGTDFSLSGGNAAIAGGHLVVAAAPGRVTEALDGFFDQCTSCDGASCGRDFGGGYGNHVVVEHDDGVTIYAHMKTGSVRVAVGDAVACGQALGEIGSSGCSTGAHLHFETRPIGGSSAQAYDPFLGMCSDASRSSWVAQGMHRGLPSDECLADCPEGVGEVWTCTAAGERSRCVLGDLTREACVHGCVDVVGGAECAPSPACPASVTEQWQCDGATRVRCVDGELMEEGCAICDGSAAVAVCRSGDEDGDRYAVPADCNDERADIFPGAPEICGDGIDQNCDGLDASCDAGDERDLFLQGGCGVSLGRAPFGGVLSLLMLVFLARRRRL